MQIPKDNLNDATAVQKTTTQPHGTSSGQSSATALDYTRCKSGCAKTEDDVIPFAGRSRNRYFSRNSTNYTVKMMEFSQRSQNEPKKHRLITRGPAGDCKARMAYNKEEAKNQPRSKAPPPMWTESNSRKSLAVDSQESTARRDERGQL